MHKKTPIIFVSHPGGIIAGPRESVDLTAEIRECEKRARQLRARADKQLDISKECERQMAELGGITHRHPLIKRWLSALIKALAYVENAEAFEGVAAKLREESLR